MSTAETQINCPLCVDMDGTLIAGDMLWESAMLLCRQEPWTSLLMPIWLLKGKAHLKEQIAIRAIPNAATLPYRGEVMEFLREQKRAGRCLVLATASNKKVADVVAKHLGIFDHVIGSDATRNVGGKGKAAELRERFGESGFEYLGDSLKDLPVWEAARGAYVVGGGARLKAEAEKRCKSVRFLEVKRGGFKGALRALRPRQWVKNVLVFLPLFLAHKASDHERLLHTVMAYIAFCLCASAIYVVNDLLDMEADRLHPRKRTRPFASGAVSVPAGLGMAALLIALAFMVTGMVGWAFAGLLVVYLALTTAYSVHVKGRLLLDVILLSYLYTHRILAGAVAAQVPLTEWLLAFSMFFFLSLAFAKRYSELVVLQEANQKQASGRSYSTDDLDIILSVGPASGYLSVLVFCLYIAESQAVKEGGLYHRPMFLWMICPVLLYWITRVWFFAKRRALVDDPVLFAVKDRVSWVAGGVALLLVILAAM